MSNLPILSNLQIISIEEIKLFVEYLKIEGKSDPESAHIIEDEIKSLVIKEISSGNLTKKEMVEKCQLILEIDNLDFPRWYA
jgi:hypothetical protein